MSRHPACTNRLIAALSDEEATPLLSRMESCVLRRGDVLTSANQKPDFVYFPISGLASVVGRADGRVIEIGLFGREGMSAPSLLLDSTQTPYECFIQSEGSAWRLTCADLLQAAADSPALERVLLHYAHVFSVQVGQTAISNGMFTIERRLARWLLMCADRLGPDIALTHDFLAIMLAVQRPGVTMAIQSLEGDGSIRATRGRVFIKDRDLLIAVAGDGYGVAEAEYNRLIGEI